MLISIGGVQIEHADDNSIFDEIDVKKGEKSLKSGIVSEKDFKQTFNETIKKAK